MERTALGVLRITAALFLLVGSCSAGPFGFEYGMTKDAVIKLVGKDAVKEDKGDTLILRTAPRPHELFESYIVIISPERGLLKVLASSQDINTSRYGDEIKAQFEIIRKGLENVYGEPTDTLDFLRAGSIWNEPRDWLMGLLKKERTLEVFWGFKPPKQHLTTVDLEATALTTETAYLRLSYEFEGWTQYLEERRAKKSDVF
jgi:hypothetical protein